MPGRTPEHDGAAELIAFGFCRDVTVAKPNHVQRHVGKVAKVNFRGNKWIGKAQNIPLCPITCFACCSRAPATRPESGVW